MFPNARLGEPLVVINEGTEPNHVGAWHRRAPDVDLPVDLTLRELTVTDDLDGKQGKQLFYPGRYDVRVCSDGVSKIEKTATKQKTLAGAFQGQSAKA